MEQFTLLEGDRTLKASREQINNALLTVRSLSSGTAFPTTDLTDGMLCYRTDHKRLYQLIDARSQTWTDKLAANLSGTADTADTVTWTNITDRPDTYPPQEHTHPYAGAAAAGGPAASADRLTTPRTINGTAFDGTTDITITTPWANITDRPDSFPAADRLTTPRTISGIPFDGTADITIPIPAIPEPYITDTYRDDTLWYRIWSDGFIQQGGSFTPNSTGYVSVTITLPTPFTTDTYTVVTSATNSGSVGNGIDLVSDRTTTAFTTYTHYNGRCLPTWFACGY